MEKMVSNSIESKGPITLLMLFYTTIGTKMIYCEAIAGINKEMDEKIKEEKTKDLYLKLDEDECKIYTEIYDKYNFMFLNAINTNSTPNYFYFELQYPTESTQESIDDKERLLPYIKPQVVKEISLEEIELEKAIELIIAKAAKPQRPKKKTVKKK